MWRQKVSTVSIASNGLLPCLCFDPNMIFVLRNSAGPNSCELAGVSLSAIMSSFQELRRILQRCAAQRFVWQASGRTLPEGWFHSRRSCKCPTDAGKCGRTRCTFNFLRPAGSATLSHSKPGDRGHEQDAGKVNSSRLYIIWSTIYSHSEVVRGSCGNP